ncbi:MAG: site-specific integrase [Bacteroides sp.]|nr:site-specific integrase [Bacteroides sp.]
MATLTRNITKGTNPIGKAEILLRLSVSRSLVVRLKTGLWIDPARFDKGTFSLPKDATARAEIRAIEDKLIDIERFLINLCEKTAPDVLTKDFLLAQYDLFLHPVPEKKKRAPREPNFFDTFEDYIEKKNISEWRIKHLRVLKRALMRYELYVRANGRSRYKIKLDDFTVDDVNGFEKFLRSEHLISEKYPDIYKVVPADTHTNRKKPKPLPKGDNTIIGLFGLLRAFYRWCREQELTTNDPFAKYNGKTTEVYGTPFYITMEELYQIADFDMSANPSLEIQRDIFIFQCLIGCRVSDLMAMTPASIINDAIEYMPQKTKSERPQVVRVPLNNRAKALVEKYAERDDLNGKLFPFISSQKYNVAIKRIFTLCGVTRMVTILNPTTREEEKRPINEIASSHLARRTFIGNLYKKVKDPNLVGSLSGHSEGSRAFARYRDIDEDMKKELVSLLD